MSDSPVEIITGLCPLKTVFISGKKLLSDDEILKASTIFLKNSLHFLYQKVEMKPTFSRECFFSFSNWEFVSSKDFNKSNLFLSSLLT